MKFLITIFISTSILYGTESLKKLGFTEFEAEKVFATIDKYTSEAPEYLKKLKDEDPKLRAEGLKYFMDMPSAPAELLVQALLKEKNEQTRTDLKKIIQSAINKPTLEDWTQMALDSLTEQFIKNKGTLEHLLEITKRNKSAQLIPKLELAFEKKSSEKDLLNIYKNSEDKLKAILFKSVCKSLNEDDLNTALASKSEALRFKAAKHQFGKANSTAVSVLLEFTVSENKEVAKESLELISTAKDINFESQIKDLVNKLGDNTRENRDQAKAILLKLPSFISKDIEKTGLQVYKMTDNAEIKINFVNIIKQKITDLIEKPGYIGVHLIEKNENDVKKVMIQSVIADTPAEKAGLPGNSQILKIDNENFEKSDLITFREHLKKLSADTEIDITIKNSAGEILLKKLRLSEKPNIDKDAIFEHWKSKNLETETSTNVQ